MSWSVPFNYLLATRLVPLQDRVSWVFIQPVPILYLAGIGGDFSDAPARCAMAVLAMICVQAFYEIGYIQNDVITTRTEAGPTLRLPVHLLEFGANRFTTIKVVRLIVGLIFFAAAIALAWVSRTVVNGALFGAALFVTMVAFHLHNCMRSRSNVATYFFLACGRYGSVPILLAPEGQLDVYMVVAVLMMPVVRTLEHACKPKYGLAMLRHIMVPFVRSRVVYYVVSCAVYGAGVLAAGWPALPGVVLLYLLVYRCAVLFVVSKKIVRPTKHSAYGD